jgi:hypothetical protein
MNFLRTQLVSKDEFWAAFRETGGVYFIRDAEADQIKIGYTRLPLARLSNLQVGNSRSLEFAGLIAAPQEIEESIHYELMEGRSRGEWFWDRGVTTEWLLRMTRGEPLCRNIWRLVPGRKWLAIWHSDRAEHTKHYWDDQSGAWTPLLQVPA